MVYSIVLIVFAEPDPNFHIYLLFGQSNMAGACNGWTATAEALDYKASDCDTTSRIKLMAFTNCSSVKSNPCGSFTLNRKHNQWYTAVPPYHNCNEGVGPGDYFGKTLLDSIRDDIRIGFIPCALSGQSITMFKKGQMSQVPDWCNEYLSQQGTVSVYNWMKEKCQIAQQSGVIKGILFHQGESDASNPNNWIMDVKSVFDNLKKDLSLNDSIPIIVGELLYAAAGGTCASMNPKVNQLASEYPRCKVASAEGLAMLQGDSYKVHFGCKALREFGFRYAKAYLSLADNNWVPRKGTVKTCSTSYSRSSLRMIVSEKTQKEVTVFTLNGTIVNKSLASSYKKALYGIHSKGVYIVRCRFSDGSTEIVPFIKN
jgi:hypothetical protein